MWEDDLGEVIMKSQENNIETHNKTEGKLKKVSEKRNNVMRNRSLNCVRDDKPAKLCNLHHCHYNNSRINVLETKI